MIVVERSKRLFKICTLSRYINDLTSARSKIETLLDNINIPRVWHNSSAAADSFFSTQTIHYFRFNIFISNYTLNSMSNFIFHEIMRKEKRWIIIAKNQFGPNVTRAL